MRKDVARNRALLLTTADRLLATRGLELTFHELAAAAGVGVGTVYRHFADKGALLDALVEQRFDAARDLLLEAEELDDPVQALRSSVMRICELQGGDRATSQLMLADTTRRRAMARERMLPVSNRIVSRAIDSGRVRSDFAETDFPMIFVLAATLSRNARGARPDLWRRYVDAILDGFMTEDADRVGARTRAPTEVETDHIATA